MENLRMHRKGLHVQVTEKEKQLELTTEFLQQKNENLARLKE